MKGCRPLTNDEIARVLTAFQGRYAARDTALYLLGIRSGFRISELLSLTVGDVSLDGIIMACVAVQRKNMKKKVEGRIVPIHEEARVALAQWLVQMPSAAPDTPLFPRRPGSTCSLTRVGAWFVLRRAYKAAGLSGPGLGTHTLRKTFAALVYEKLNHDLVKMQKALGHRNINSTVSYISFLDSDINAAIMAA